MAKIDPSILLTAIHGMADKTSGLYLKQDKRTGKIYAVKYRNKPTKSSELQSALRQRFAEVSKCSTAFVKAGRAAVESGEVTPLANAYLKVAAAFNEQTESAFLRSYVMKHHARVSETGEVSVVVDDFTFTNAAPKV